MVALLFSSQSLGRYLAAEREFVSRGTATVTPSDKRYQLPDNHKRTMKKKKKKEKILFFFSLFVLATTNGWNCSEGESI